MLLPMNVERIDNAVKYEGFSAHPLEITLRLKICQSWRKGAPCIKERHRN